MGNAQLSLITPRTRHDEILEDFAQYHRANPDFYREFCKLAQRVIDRGFSKYSADNILRVVRFHADLKVGEQSTGFKVNNNFSAYYGRMWELDHPAYPNFFSKRRLTSRDEPAKGHRLTKGDYPEIDLEADLAVTLRELLRETGEQGREPE